MSRPINALRARLSIESLEHRITPSWTSVPPSSVVVPTSFTNVYLNSTGDASGNADVSSAGEIDWYRLIAPVSGTFKLGADTHASGLNSVLGVYGSTGKRVSYNDNVSTTDPGSALSVTLTAAATYYVGVTNLTGAAGGGYLWSVDGPPVIDDGFEDNDTAATAYNLGNLPVSSTLTGLKLEDAADWFRFTTRATGITGNAASISFSTSAGNLDLQLFDGAGNLLATSATTSSPETVSLAGRPAGDYLVRVYGFNGVLNPSYTMSLKVPLVDDAFEENDARTTAHDFGALTASASYSNLVLADYDWYKFTTALTGTAGNSISVGFTNALGNVDLALYSASGSVLKTSASTTGNGESISLSGLAAGTYYAYVSGYRGATNPNYTLTFAPPTAADWYAANLTDFSVRSRVIALNGDGSLSRSDMLDVFDEVASDGVVSTAEFNDLQKIVGNTSVIGMDAPVRGLSQKVVLGNVANAKYQGAVLGNLAAGDSATRLNTLVNKWFFGLDHPAASGTYVEANGTLFGNSDPSYDQIRQGSVGDCYLLAGLGGVVQQNATSIEQMFTDNGDGTFTVRFYLSGVADYVTVDDYLPATSGGTFVYANMGDRLNDNGNVLWVALAEKAYAQENESGKLGQEVAANSYISIDGGSPGTAMTQITNRANVYATTSSLTFATVQSHFDAGQAEVFGTTATPAAGIVANHAYTVVGYDPVAQTLTLLNPWGANNVNPPGLVTLTMTQIKASFYGWWYC